MQYTLDFRCGFFFASFDITCVPRPQPYQWPVHHVWFILSCLNSQDKNTAIKNLYIAHWIWMTAMRPNTAYDVSHNS